MTSISSNTAAYYQLFGQQTSTQTSGASSTPSLADVLDASDAADAADSSDNSAYTLDLSPEAQALMNNSDSASSLGLSSLDTGSTSSTDSSTFTLTQAQQTQVNNILAKYKDAPYTQATFDSIQNDLNAAGLSTQQLSLQDQVQNFNPTTELIGYLDGSNTSITPTDPTSDEQSKSSNFMQSIVSQWQSISTTYAAAASDADTTTTSGA